MASRVRAPAAIPPTPRRDAIAGPNGSRRAVPPGTPLFDGMLTAVSKDHPNEGRLDGLVRRSLLAMLEERGTWQSSQAHLAR